MNYSSQPGRQVTVSANTWNYSRCPEVNAMGWRVKVISVSKENHLEIVLGEASYLEELGCRQASCEDTQPILRVIHLVVVTCGLQEGGHY